MIPNRLNRQPSVKLVNSPEVKEVEVRILGYHEITNQLAEYMVAQQFTDSRVDDAGVDGGTTATANLKNFADTGWKSKAKCKDAEFADINFFPKTGDSAIEAKQVCAVCPVMMECLIYALEANEPCGIWGGASAKMRRSMSPTYRKLKK